MTLIISEGQIQYIVARFRGFCNFYVFQLDHGRKYSHVSNFGYSSQITFSKLFKKLP